jgi:hypothetical protein
MTPRCQIGQLAYIRHDDDYPENVNRVVQIVGPATCLIDELAWSCRVDGVPLSVFNVDTNETYLDHEGDIYDADLVPISGVRVGEEIAREVTV